MKDEKLFETYDPGSECASEKDFVSERGQFERRLLTWIRFPLKEKIHFKRISDDKISLLEKIHCTGIRTPRNDSFLKTTVFF